MISVRTLQPNEWSNVATLIHDSTNAWYTGRGMPACFSNGPASTMLFCEFYEALDPGCCFVAVDSGSNEIVGSCFWHPRPTHVSLGIMNVHPGHFGRGIASQLLRSITGIADQRHLPVRLVSSAMNLDSFSLYNRAGFVPQSVFQDMLIRVSEQTLESADCSGQPRVRPATEADIAGMVRLEHDLSGIQREKDFRFFVQNRMQVCQILVAEDPRGGLDGFLAAVRHPASNMIGPGVARNQDVMIALTARMLRFHLDNTAVMLVPATASKLAGTLYRWGARNCELHLSQVRGNTTPPSGIVIPSFMPESG